MIIADHQIFISRRPGRGRKIPEPTGNKGAKMLQRVKKDDAKRDDWQRPDPVDYCLSAWKDWMTTGGERNLGARIMGGLVGESDGHGTDVNEAQHSHDMIVGAATDAMIDSLPRLHVWAIYASCSIATTWRFPNADLVTTAAEARAALTDKLKKNECTRNLF